MKKTYISPLCEAYALSTGRLFDSPASLPVSGDKADDGGWSKKFWGLTDDDDDDEKDFAWD